MALVLKSQDKLTYEQIGTQMGRRSLGVSCSVQWSTSWSAWSWRMHPHA